MSSHAKRSGTVIFNQVFFMLFFSFMMLYIDHESCLDWWTKLAVNPYLRSTTRKQIPVAKFQ